MKKPTGFEKFVNKKKAGTVKEGFRKEKREHKQEVSRKQEERKQAVSGKTPSSKTPSGKVASGQVPSSKVASSKVSPGKSTSGKTAAVKKETSPSAAGPSASAAGEQMPLNKFIAHAGVCARRDAAALVKTGVVTVNGQPVAEPGFKVSSQDTVQLNGRRLQLSRQFVYILLNKPKDYITTTEDPQGRKTVLDLIKTATEERVYPIGRLDRNTSGVLLFTNDGELAQALSHPKNKVKKIYEVKLDRPLARNDFEAILKGLNLEDGIIAPDALGYADPRDRSVIGIEIHSGRNRIVRRIFEHLQYEVRALDRVMYAGLTKKNVNRGKWRHLSEKEVRLLKHFSKK